MTRWQAMAGDRRRPALIGAGALAAVALVAALVLLTGGGGDDVAATGTSKDKTTATAPSTTTTAAPTTPTAPPTTTTTAAPTTTVPPTTAAPLTTAPPSPPPPIPAPTAAGGALCIGDSVMLGAGPENANALGLCGVVDAVESRQASAGPDVLAGHAPFPSTVVVHLGTNGTVAAADMDAMLGSLQGVDRVVLVTVQHNGTRSWEGQANGEITAAAGRWPNARVADWKGYSDGHPEWFSVDGIHLSTAGAQPYADVIAGAMG